MRHKPGKEQIIPDVLNRLVNTNRARHNDLYSELDALFTYHASLVEISLDLVRRILDGYLTDDWWTKVRRQLLSNKDLGSDKAVLPFVFGSTENPSSGDPYFLLKPESQGHASDFLTSKPAIAMHAGRDQLIYHLDCVTSVCRLCIPPVVAPDLLAITYSEGPLGFAHCHKIISRSWYI